jgi:tRNA(fMet)-specific endonuclease VapC
VKYLLDTDHLSILLRRTGPEHDRLWDRMDEHLEEEFAFSVVSFHEQMMGCHQYISRNRRAELLRGYDLIHDLLNLYCPARILPFDAAAQTEFERLRGQKVRIATMDLRIASTAIVERLVLLTRNARDFAKVPGLTCEDWTVP